MQERVGAHPSAVNPHPSTAARNGDVCGSEALALRRLLTPLRAAAFLRCKALVVPRGALLPARAPPLPSLEDRHDTICSPPSVSHGLADVNSVDRLACAVEVPLKHVHGEVQPRGVDPREGRSEAASMLGRSLVHRGLAHVGWQMEHGEDECGGRMDGGCEQSRPPAMDGMKRPHCVEVRPICKYNYVIISGSYIQYLEPA